MLTLPNRSLGQLAIGLFSFSICGLLFAQPSGSITLFGKVGASEALSNSSITQADEQDIFAADILGTLNYKKFDLIAEYEVDGDNSSIERLQFGYRFTDSSQIWVGKFHNPAEYWLQEYHRGYYLQPSTSVPFESFAGYQGGATSKHLAGIRFDNEFMLGEDSHQIQTYLTIADTPNISAEEQFVDADDLFSDFDEDHLLTSIKLSYKPDPLSESAIGFTYTKATAETHDQEILDAIPVAVGLLLAGLDVDISLTNAFINLESDRAKLLYSDSNMRVELVPTPESFNQIATIFASTNFSQKIQLRYLHGEYYFNDRWSGFARYEQVSSGGSEMIVESLLNDFGIESEYKKQLIGLRFDPAINHAINLQYTNHKTRFGDENNIHLNWSFVLDWGF